MAIPTKGRKKKEKKQQLVERTPGSPLKLFSKNKKVPQSSQPNVKQFGTQMEKDRAKKARIENKTKRVKDKGSKKSKEKLADIFGGQFERHYARRGKKGLTRGKKAGGMVKGYAEGGSVSRGQYPSQPKKVKFKGVF